MSSGVGEWKNGHACRKCRKHFATAHMAATHYRWAEREGSMLVKGTDRNGLGASIYDVRKIFGILDPFPPLSAFGTDLQY